MNINRHNYEEFFLLYVDNELSAADRKAVDVFVKANPDLLIELEALQQTVIKPEIIALDKKDWLYMQQDASLLQENLLLYADNELSAADKETVEKLLLTDETVRTEWNILQQTIAEPDHTILFEDKQSLYRKESGRVVSFKWWRVAAAAVLLGAGLWTGVKLYNNTNIKTGTESGELATGTRQQVPQTNTNETPAPVTQESSTPESTVNETLASVTENSGAAETKKDKQVVEENNRQRTIIPADNMTAKQEDNKKPNNNLPKPYFENINNNNSNETVATTVLPEITNNRIVSGNNSPVKSNPNEKTDNFVVTNLKRSTTDPAVAMPAVNKTNADEGNNRYLDVDDDKEKRTALGGLLRKAKRVLERTTNIKTGESIKVAGFEIALK